MFLKFTDWSLGKFVSVQTQHKCAHNHQRAYRIIITTAATAPNIPLIVQTIITSHTGIAYHVEYNAQGTLRNHVFSLLISVDCACVEHYPWIYCIRYKVWRALTFLPKRRTWKGLQIAMGWDGNGTDKYVPWTTLQILPEKNYLWTSRRNLCVCQKSQIFSQPRYLKLWTWDCS